MQPGQDIGGEAEDAQFDTLFALSADPRTVAAGTPGYVRVFSSAETRSNGNKLARGFSRRLQ